MLYTKEQVNKKYKGKYVEIAKTFDGKCLYCEDSKQTEDLHFVCEDCGNGMCDVCYDHLIDHDYHYHEVIDNMKDKKAIKKLQEKFGEGGPTYICEVCLGKHYLY